LQVGRHIELGMIVLERQLAEVLCAALRSDGPHYICQVLRPELGRWSDLVDLGADNYSPMTALHVSIALGLRHERGADHVHFGFAAKVAVVHRFNRAAY